MEKPVLRTRRELQITKQYSDFQPKMDVGYLCGWEGGRCNIFCAMLAILP